MGELWGIADGTDFDLTQHQEYLKQDMSYFDDEKKAKYVFLTLLSLHLEQIRMVLAFLCSAYDGKNWKAGM